MMRSVLAAVALLFAIPVAACADEAAPQTGAEALCSKPTVEEAVACVKAELAKEEQRLEAAFNTALTSNAMDDRAKGLLRQAHRAWMVFRNAECQWAGDEFRGDAREAFIMGVCLTDLTAQRADNLEDLLD